MLIRLRSYSVIEQLFRDSAENAVAMFPRNHGNEM